MTTTILQVLKFHVSHVKNNENCPQGTRWIRFSTYFSLSLCYSTNRVSRPSSLALARERLDYENQCKRYAVPTLNGMMMYGGVALAVATVFIPVVSLSLSTPREMSL